MALRAAGALVRARVLAAWSRVRRDSGGGGAIAVAGLSAVVALVLALPAITLTRLAADLGRSWDGTPGMAARWAALQAIFTLLFPLAGALRYRPVFEPKELGALPVRAVALLLAELPATLLEVFPLLAAVGVLSTHLGLVMGNAALLPLAALSALLALPAVPATTLLAAGLWRSSRAVRGVLGLLALGAAFAIARAEGRAALRSFAQAVVAALPTTLCAEAELARSGGAPIAAIGLLAVAGAITVLLLAAAARLRLRWRDAESPRPAAWLKSAVLGRSRRAAGAIAGVFLAQLVDARGGRTLLWLPLLLTAPFALVVGVVALDGADLRALPPPIVAAVAAAVGSPLYLLAPVGAVCLDSAVWLNPFGWYRRGVRSLLTLPVSPHELLRGTLVGSGLFAAAQAVLALVPLWAVRPPRASELLAGAAGAAFAAVFLGGIGQALGLQFPRTVAREGSAEIPFHLSWLPPLLVAAASVAVALVFRLAGRVSELAAAGALALLAGIALAGYAVTLPLLAQELERARERLASI